MSARFLIALVAVVIFTAGCNPIYTSYDFDKDADFERYQTYSWYVIPDTIPQDAREAIKMNPLTAKRIRRGIDEQLADKGLRLVDEGGDLLVFYHTGGAQLVVLQRTMYSGMDLWATSRVGGSANVQEITQGALIIDLFDVQAKQLVWRGIAENARKEDAPPGQVNDTIDKAIVKIFEQYPPR